jgi:hypothetical protein
MYTPLLSKPWIRIKCPLHTDLVIFRLRRQASLNELFAPKGIQTLDLMGLP